MKLRLLPWHRYEPRPTEGFWVAVLAFEWTFVPLFGFLFLWRFA